MIRPIQTPVRSPVPSIRSRQRGFTLIEVLATMMLLAIILPVAMRGVSLAMQTSSHARHVSEGAELARNKLGELTLATDTSQFTGTGSFGDQWRDYRWESRFTSREYGTYELTVEVFWKEQSVDRSLVLSTLTYLSSTSSSDTASTSSDSTGGTTP